MVLECQSTSRVSENAVSMLLNHCERQQALALGIAPHNPTQHTAAALPPGRARPGPEHPALDPFDGVPLADRHASGVSHGEAVVRGGQGRSDEVVLVLLSAKLGRGLTSARHRRSCIIATRRLTLSRRAHGSVSPCADSCRTGVVGEGGGRAIGGESSGASAGREVERMWSG